ncbi:HNH endonuclease [Salmonella enterica subsp. enterica serovar Ajiobo]|nr:HNH endonuclease [Salmonella enterica]EBW2365380.1 HNH endonuclease [Salmonella enterica subsp. enterica serovar Ajiobo]EDU0171274.1 HNH endonuclease [Salmonella enterica subsp. enterica serovar Belfast]EIR2646007.1 HNH endonuclease [Salmonella enterica subsp. enterica serovar Enteritidis]EDN5728464.1 HNH endonuclease [Salmonella enterica subsp. enterica serovar Ajiobo]
MPWKPLKRCTYPGCRNRVESGRCTSHQQKECRGTAAQRGYNHRWQVYRAQYLKANPLCVICYREGRFTPATVVDHITPVNGQRDPLFWKATNHQGLCRDCHSWKTRMIDKRGYGAKA